MESWMMQSCLSSRTTLRGHFLQGTFKVQEVNVIIFRLRMLESEIGCILHAIHITGTHMKRSDIDGL